MQGFVNVANDTNCTYQPFAGFTTVDLGCERGNNAFNYVVKLDALPKGSYRWAVSLVDKTKGNTPGLQMAVAEDSMRNGWLILNKVTIK